MAQCGMCNGIGFVMAARMRRPCPRCGGSGTVAGGTCSTCRHRGNVVDNILNVSLLALKDVYCKKMRKTVSPSGPCSSYES